MKIVLSWLKEFLPQGALDSFSNEEIGDVFTSLGMVTESIDTVGVSLDGVVVARVREITPHPKADRIRLVSVDAGLDEPLQICCGAQNFAEGDRVPLATVGTTLPSGMEIAARKMRGEDSFGMLCAAEEVGLGHLNDEDGLFILDEELTVGEPLQQALNLSTDSVFDLDLEGNRPDALSVAGVARDLAAKIGVEFIQKKPIIAESARQASEQASVAIAAPQKCGAFAVRVLENVTLGETPQLMKDRLAAAGMRSINVIVDISNYVMLELGQPNHAYDLDLVPQGSLGVRLAKDGEALTTLDDIKRTLIADDIVITNANDEAIGLAGVMGGASTEISQTSTRVVVEAALWDQMTIAHTSRRLALRSEASTRFERGIDSAGVELALDRFCELAAELCGAEIAQGVVSATGEQSPAPVVSVRPARVNAYLTSQLTSEEMQAMLAPIGFETVNQDGDTFSVQVPTWRPDSSLEVDIIEEIGRHWGYDKVAKATLTPAQSGGLTLRQKNRRRLRQTIQGLGFTEAMPMPFISPEDLEAAGLPTDKIISLENPLVHAESILRTSLLPGLLKSIAYNQSHRNGVAQFYELGKVFEAVNGSDDLPNETLTAALCCSGCSPGDNAAFKAVSWLHALADQLHVSSLQIVNEPIAGLHPTRSAKIVFRGKTLGQVGEVDPSVLEQYNVSDRVAWLQFDVEPLLAALVKPPKQKTVSRFPSSDFDIAIVVPNTVDAQAVKATIGKACGELAVSVTLFDTFRSDSLGDARSLAYAIRLQAQDRTLTDDEAATVRQNCIDAVAKKHNGTLR